MLNKRKFLICLVLAVLLCASIIAASCTPVHQHDYSGEWQKNSTQHWKKCSGCDETDSTGNHSVTSWITDKTPTADEEGMRHGSCDVCGYVVNETIGKTNCQHDFSGAYVYNDDVHYKKCLLCQEPSEAEQHTVSNWIIDKEASETEEGLKHGVCDVCKNTVSKTIPELSHTHSYSVDWKSDANNHWKACSCGDIQNLAKHTKKWVVDVEATETHEGSKHEECSVCKKVFQTAVIDKIDTSTRTVDLYAINDFHGTVDRISQTGGYLKGIKNSNPNTLFVNSGDMFQGSMESNSNFGKLLTDSMTQIGFDAFTFGNHEFDWGLQNLQNLANQSTVPFLGANIYHWNASSKTWGTFADELAQKYVIKTLDNGLKVGIIGVIGADQITSISSNLVQTIGFKEPLPIIKELATELRNDKGCDVVVVSAHVGPQGLVGEEESNQAPSTAAGLEAYVDAVFCAHTHRQQVYTVDGLPFIQGGSNGQSVSHIQLSVTSGKVTCTENKNISFSSSWDNLASVDTLIDNSNDKIKDEKNQVLATLSAGINKNPATPRLVSRAIAEYAKNQGYDIALAMVNTARASLPSGQLTYSELYEAVPFDNEVYIAKVKGSEIINEAKYASFWRSSGEAINSTDYYYIAIIDYLLFHQNSKRNYDYFKSAFTSGFTPVALTKNGQTYNYRNITRDWLLSNTSVAAGDYTSAVTNTDSATLTSAVTLKYETTGSWKFHDNVIGGGGNNSNENDGGTGTLSDPYTVAKALEKAATASSKNDAPSGYVKGTVCDIPSNPIGSQSGDYGKFYIKDDKGNKIYVYYISKHEGATLGNNWSGADDLQVGDEIVIYATSIYTYNQNTPQIGGGYCAMLNGSADF